MAEDIAQWLDGHGLGQYAQAFAENDIARSGEQLRSSISFRGIRGGAHAAPRISGARSARPVVTLA